MSIRDLRLLRLIGAVPDISMGLLVEQAGLEKTLASKHVSGLVQRGLVDRHVSRSDARQILLTLSDEGEAIVRKAEPIGHEMEVRFLDALTENEVASLRRILCKLIKAEADSREVFDFLIAKLRESRE